ncbi:MAG: DUF2892 domain-containing protein [Verrucomicrobiota bacterium]
MNTENIIRALAGSLVLASLALAHFVHPGFLLLTAFVGLNLLQSAFTGLCPAESILRRLRPSRPAAQPSPGNATPRSCCNPKPSA